MKSKIIYTLSLIILLALASLVSAQVTIEEVNQESLHPGQQARLSLEISNDFNYDIEDVSLSLIFGSVQQGQINLNQEVILSSVGSSTDNQDKINEDDSESFGFDIKASNNAVPGTYNIGYILSYKRENTNETIEKTGTIGITIKADPIIELSLDSENNIIGQRGTIKIKIVNKGLADARFVNLKVKDYSGITLLSSDNVYFGTIDSDDFDNANFNVIFSKKSGYLNIELEYMDFENDRETITEELAFSAYTQEEAIQKSILKKNNTSLYVIGIILFLLVWFIIRKIRKNRKNNK